MKCLAIKSIISFFAFLLVSASAALAQQTPQITVAENQPPAAQTNVVKVCVALPKMRLAEGNATETASALRGVIAQYLKSASIEAVGLETLQPPAILAEAKGKNCKFILQTSLGQKKGADFGEIFGSLAPMLGNIVPATEMNDRTAGAIAGQVASTAIQTAANTLSNVKSKDQITFEYSLASVNDNAKIAGEILKAKAKSDGEDVVSPMIEKMTAVVQTAAK